LPALSNLERLDINALELLKLSTAFLTAALSVSETLLEFNIAGAVSEKNLSKFWLSEFRLSMIISLSVLGKIVAVILSFTCPNKFPNK